MLVSSVRSPLSLGLCENNQIHQHGASASSSSSGPAPSYHYPEANRCEEVAWGVRDRLGWLSRRGRFAAKKFTAVSIRSLITAVSVGVAVVLSRTSGYRRLLIPLAVIGAIFFFVICLPKLFGIRKELNEVKVAENQIYRQAETLINDIFTRISAVNTIFPEGAIVEGQLTENFAINQELQDHLDRWIDTLRLVHGWDIVTRSGVEGNLRHLNGFGALTTHLPDIIQSIESSRDAVEVIADPDSIWPGDTLNTSTTRAKQELRRLVESIGLLNEARAAVSTGVAATNNP